MCDYSLENVASRKAEVGDKLVTTKFSNAFTRGFSAAGAPDVAVCLLPSTEIAFDSQIRSAAAYSQCYGDAEETTHSSNVGIFVQLDTDRPHTHHDALELPDGSKIKLNDLLPGQTATVLQLPKLTTVSHVELPADCEASEPVSPAVVETAVYAI